MLPIAAVIETAQHVQRIANGHHRRVCAQALRDRVIETLDDQLPWVVVPVEWDEPFVRELFDQTPPYPVSMVEGLATQTAEAGDLMLLTEMRRLRRSFPSKHFEVRVRSHDQGLRDSAATIH